MSGIRRFINRIKCRDADTHSLIIAVRSGNLAKVKRLMLDCGVEPIDPEFMLLEAASRGHVDIVRFFLEYGVDPNVQDNYGWTPLHLALWFCNVDAARVPLDHGAGLTIRDNEGRTPLTLLLLATVLSTLSTAVIARNSLRS
jgi:ankyrin repeat protein